MLKRLFWLGVLTAIIYYGAQYEIDGKPIKQYAKEFYQSPIVQAALKSGREMLRDFINEKVGDKEKGQEGLPKGQAKGDDQITVQDQKALEEVLEKESR